MKIKSLILSSVAAVGFSSGAMAADLGTVLTSLDVCDALGISGLTISSDTNCLAITGGVAYEFKWGDYNGTGLTVNNVFTNPANDIVGGLDKDWHSKVDAWLKFVGTADSSFGPASATIKLGFDEDYTWVNEVATPGDPSGGGLVVDEAYVSVGDTTVLMAGKKGTIANYDDDKSLTWLKLFNDEVGNTYAGLVTLPTTGGHVIQVTSDLGNGVAVGGALENLGGTGTAVGVLSYAGDGITAHATLVAGNILNTAAATWAIHAGMTGTFDMFTIGGAVAADSAGDWDAQGTASVTYDMFTLAVAGQAGYDATAVTNNAGFAVSASAEVTEGVTINGGFRWFDTDTATALGSTEGWQAAAELVAAVTETITLTGEIGVYGDPTTVTTNAYGSGEVAWAPGGGFTSSVKGTVWGSGAYSVTFKAAKDFE